MNDTAEPDFSTWLRIPSDSLAAVAGVLILVMMVHVTADVFGRLAFSAPIDGTLEIVAGYYMVAVVFLPLAHVSRGEGHIFIELFTRGLPERVRSCLDAAAATLTLFYVALMAWQTAVEAMIQTEGGELWETADDLIVIWPSRWLIPIGCALMAVLFACLVLRHARAGRAR
ncbi:MAG: TRAP transporter small permease [Defluviicoccus sp.]|nr:TRAP transporter small permease [Defluviicoccus sp.]